MRVIQFLDNSPYGALIEKKRPLDTRHHRLKVWAVVKDVPCTLPVAQYAVRFASSIEGLLDKESLPRYECCPLITLKSPAVCD